MQGRACSQGSLEGPHKAVGIADLEEVTSVLYKPQHRNVAFLVCPRLNPVARVLQSLVGQAKMKLCALS